MLALEQNNSRFFVLTGRAQNTLPILKKIITATIHEEIALCYLLSTKIRSLQTIVQLILTSTLEKNIHATASQNGCTTSQQHVARKW